MTKRVYTDGTMLVFVEIDNEFSTRITKFSSTGSVISSTLNDEREEAYMFRRIVVGSLGEEENWTKISERLQKFVNRYYDDRRKDG